MAIEIKRALIDLAEYARKIEGDPEKAERVRHQLEQMTKFLEEEGFSDVFRPQKELEAQKQEELEQKYVRWQNHLAAVAKEALRVEGGQFLHDTQASVVRALKPKIEQGDQGLISTYAPSTLASHISLAGKELILGSVIKSLDYHDLGRELRMPLTELNHSNQIIENVPFEGWIETLRYAESALPQGTSALETGFLLLNFSQRNQVKDVTTCLEQVRKDLQTHQ